MIVVKFDDLIIPIYNFAGYVCTIHYSLSLLLMN